MADPIFNLKTGADTDLYFAREVTAKGANLGKIKTKDGIYKYPVLTRSTGNSIKGSAEQIESNELRKGRTKGPTRKGNNSAEGSQDIELSPITYDDMLEAVFRNKWKRWEDDTESEINIDKDYFQTGSFLTKCTESANGSFGKRKLLNEDEGDGGLIPVPKGCVVHELTCGSEDIKYTLLKKFGGVKGEDLYQRFEHMAVNSLSLSVQINSIITGSIGFMGTSDPKMLGEDAITEDFGGDKTDLFADGKTTGKEFLASLPEKATSTDQFTAREGFLYVNGKNIEFANSLDMEINNGLEKKFAIFVPGAIAFTPLTLDISGTLKTYMVFDGADEIFNKAVDNDDTEILFVFQDRDVNPSSLYVFQIFKNKFTDHDAAVNGADTLDVSFPFSSFEERAVRCFRILLPKVADMEVTKTEGGSVNGLVLTPNVEVRMNDIADKVSIAVSIDNEEVDVSGKYTLSVDEDEESPTYKNILVEFDSAVATPSDEEKVCDITVSLNGEELKRSFEVQAA